MRIAYLINGLNGGGAAFPIPDLVALMREQGHEVRVLALMPQDRKASAGLDRVGIEWTLLGKGEHDYLAQARALLSDLRARRPDLIWTSLTRGTVYGQIAGRMLGIPVVSWQHNAFLKPGNRVLLGLSKRLTALWIADSQTVADFTAQTLDVDPKDIAVWPIFRARSEAPQAKACPPGERFRVGSLGRLHPNKNYRHLIEAAISLRATAPALSAQIEFVIGGSGPEHEALAAQVQAAGLSNVRLAGFIDDAGNFLASLHAYIQPSHHEGMGIAAHEAMQAALPVIATRVGELQRSVLPDVTGALCEIGDVPALAAAIADLASDPARAARLGAASRARVLELFGDSAFRQAGLAALQRAMKRVASGRIIRP